MFSRACLCDIDDKIIELSRAKQVLICQILQIKCSYYDFLFLVDLAEIAGRHASFGFENAVETKNSFDELKIDKRDSLRGNRIDPVDACIDAHFCYMQDKGEEPVNHDDAMTDYLTEMGW